MTQVISEHVLGGIDEVDDFVQAFVEKRKATDYLSVGVANLSRFSMENIAVYKETFKQVSYDVAENKLAGGSRLMSNRSKYPMCGVCLSKTLYWAECCECFEMIGEQVISRHRSHRRRFI